ncbi:MAG: hypothetical protein ACHP79_11740, partial [Terriglobales bacterium]
MQRGITPFFGGRSTLWSAWSPRPTAEELRGWPPELIGTLQEYFPHAEELLSVLPADEIKDRTSALRQGGSIYGTLQESLTRMLRDGAGNVPSATRVSAAPLAAAAFDRQGMDFHKFSTPPRFLSLFQRQRRLAETGQGAPLKIVTNCVVQRILDSGGRATALETSRGTLPLGNARVILAMGTLPVTTLVMNSFPEIRNAGRRYSAHFLSSLVARVPREDFSFCHRLNDLELAAIYVAGAEQKDGGQYHIQLTALADKHPAANAATANRYMPDSLATASLEQLMTSTSHILFACAVVGELDHRNPQNWFKRNEECDDPAANMVLQVTPNDRDRTVWNTMEEATFQALERVLSPGGPVRIEYWRRGEGAESWQRGRPSIQEMRASALF